MNADEEQMPEEAPAGGNTIALFLGLYLLILAFFILLVSISTLEEVRTQQIMDSLSSTFTTILPPSTELTPFEQDEGDIVAGQQFQERITGIFATTLQIAKVDVVQPGRLMKVSLPVSSMFEPNNAEMRNVQLELLDRIVAAVSGRPSGTRYDLEFVIGSKFVPGTENLPIGETLEMARAGSFAREMLSRGVPPDSVSVGMRRGDPTQVDIWFHVREIEEARLRFDQLLENTLEQDEEVPTADQPEAAPTSVPSPTEGLLDAFEQATPPATAPAPAATIPGPQDVPQSETPPPAAPTTDIADPTTGGEGGGSIPLPLPPGTANDSPSVPIPAPPTGGPTDDGGFILPPRPGG